MKKIILALIAMCCAFMCYNALAQDEAAADAEAEMDVLQSYGEGNVSDETTFVSLVDFYGPVGMYAAQTVKFTAPRDGWTLNRVDIAGWDGFNGSQGSLREPDVVALEVRDSNLNLLYRFADSSWSYSNFALNISVPTRIRIDLPAVPVSGDFYVSFYDRGAILVGGEINETGESYIYDKAANQLIPSNLPDGNNTTVPVNWIMWAIGN